MSRKRCIGFSVCGLCVAACPENAIDADSNGIRIERSRCKDCISAGVFFCAVACPAKALTVKGEIMSVETILDAVEREEIFYHHGNGGLTVSGGEPLMHGEGLIRLLHEAKRRRFNTAMETCGFGAYTVLREAARYLDMLFFDIKSTDDAKHLEYTGASNTVILANFAALRSDIPQLPITVRTPVIPGFNNDPEELERISRIAGTTHELLPYHRFGEWKYEALGRVFPL